MKGSKAEGRLNAKRLKLNAKSRMPLNAASGFYIHSDPAFRVMRSAFRAYLEHFAFRVQR
jgi:hypothetical protein